MAGAVSSASSLPSQAAILGPAEQSAPASTPVARPVASSSTDPAQSSFTPASASPPVALTGGIDTGQYLSAYKPRPDGVYWKDLPEKQTDGKLLGNDGYAYDASALDQIPAFAPAKRPDAQALSRDQPVIYVNGVLNTAEQAAKGAQALADSINKPVIPFHNSSSGFIADGAETLAERYLGIQSAPSQALSKLVVNELAAGHGVNISAHSQGAEITSSALQQVKQSLMKDYGLNDAQATSVLGRIDVTTYGGAGANYPSGPSYNHKVNLLDPVPMIIGSTPPTGAPGSAGNTTVDPKVFGLDPHSLGQYLKY